MGSTWGGEVPRKPGISVYVGVRPKKAKEEERPATEAPVIRGVDQGEEKKPTRLELAAELAAPDFGFDLLSPAQLVSVRDSIDRGELFDIAAETAPYFDDSSLSHGQTPRVVILMGGTGAGKSRRRKQHYATGYVLVDAGDIFIRLSRGAYLPFPGEMKEPMDIIGCLIAQRAIVERRHIVTEIIGGNFDATTQLMDTMRASGYEVSLEYIECDIEKAWQNNINRGDDNISSYYSEPYQRNWLVDAARHVKEIEDSDTQR